MKRTGIFKLIIFGVVVAILFVPAVLTFRFAYLNSIKVDETKVNEIKKKFDLKTLQYFGEIAFGPEHSDDDYKLSKWEKNVITIGIYGQLKENDEKRFLLSAIDTINSILRHHKLIVDNRTEDQDIKMYFLKFEEIIERHPDAQQITQVGGFIEYQRTFWNSLKGIQVTINNSMIQEARRKHVILEELTQSLGLMRDSYTYPHSIFYEEYSSDTVLSGIDKNLLSLLYNYDLPSGLQKQTFENQILE